MKIPAYWLLPLLLSYAPLMADTINSDVLQKRLNEALVPDLEKQVISGAVTLVVNADKVLHLHAVGYRDLASKTPMQKDDLFWIASMTKPVSALALMMLVEEGKLQLNDEVAKYLPEFAAVKVLASDGKTLEDLKRPLTVHDMLVHTNGLQNNAQNRATQLRELVKGYAAVPLKFQPGTQWSYSNPGINVLGALIEVLSGQDFASFLETRLFGPLGMKDTGFYLDDVQAKRVATSYKFNKQLQQLEPVPVFFLNGREVTDRKRIAFPAGGLYSTAPDLAKLYQLFLRKGELDGKRYFKESTLAVMTQNQLGDMPRIGFAPGMQMGLGFQIVAKPQGVTEALHVGSYGHGGAYGTQAWNDPEAGLAMVLLIQRAGLENADQSSIRRVWQNTVREIFGKLSPKAID